MPASLTHARVAQLGQEEHAADEKRRELRDAQQQHEVTASVCMCVCAEGNFAQLSAVLLARDKPAVTLEDDIGQWNDDGNGVMEALRVWPVMLVRWCSGVRAHC